MRIVSVMLIVFCALCLAEEQTSGIQEENRSEVGQQESEIFNDSNKRPFPTPPNQESRGDEDYQERQRNWNECGPNEKLYKCGVASPETCEYVNESRDKQPSGSCGPHACGCIKGYVRDMNNVCVKAKTYCIDDNDNGNDDGGPHIRCPPNQKYYRCGLRCPQTCQFVNETCNFRRGFACKPERDGLCGCIDNYVRNDKNKCVPANEYCNPNENGQGNEKECKGRNEVYSECCNPCSQTCETLNLPCAEICKLGGACFCRSGYVRNKQEMCVRADRYCNQTVSCGKNEVFSSCAPLCERQCNIMFKCVEGCEPKCVCAAGFIRNDEHQCILESQCPPLPNESISSSEESCEKEKCVGKHKVYSTCGRPPECTPTCDNPIVHGDFCGTVCVKGCFCEAGYVLNQFGECIPPKECPEINPNSCSQKPNEIYLSCGQPEACAPTCDDPKLYIACDAVCVKGCFCKKGYLRNSSGICVVEQNCPGHNTCTGANEQFFSCGSPADCTPTCDDRKINVTCLAVCTKGCYCKTGYLRNSRGVCVREQDCPVNSNTCVGEHKYFTSCGTPAGCVRTCENPQNDRICQAVCVDACVCERGYLINANGDCIKEEYCRPPNTCGPNQVYRTCGPLQSCLPTCEKPHNTMAPCLTICAQGCYCESGYLRNANGKCIKEEICLEANPCGPNQVYKTCGRLESCLPTCENPNNTQTPCPTVCVKGCYCEPGYLRNSYGVCIKEEVCLKSNVCPKHQIFKQCGQPKWCLPTCEEPNKIVDACTDNCVQDCYCEPGYLMNNKGDCIKAEYCPIDPTKCDDPRKVYDTCGTPAECTPTCENPINTKICPKMCVRGCFCKAGYLINKDGKCIKSSKCAIKCEDPHKEYNSCGKPVECMPTCENPINNKFCRNQCNPGCFCKQKYLMNKDGKCIRSSRCPPKDSTKCMGAHKVYNKCGLDSICLPTCENPHNTRPCPNKCTEGCFCEDGYLVNQNGDCVPEKRCPFPR